MDNSVTCMTFHRIIQIENSVQIVIYPTEFSIEGARVFAKDVLANLQGVKDVKISFSGSGYDVYTLTNE